MNFRRTLSTSAVALGAVLLSVGLQAFAYTAPSAGPTGGDAYAPINTGPAAQVKTGDFRTNGVLTSLQMADVGGAVNPTTGIGLQVNGQVQILGANLRVPDILNNNAAVIATRYCFGSNNSVSASPVNCITAWPSAVDTSAFINTSGTAQTKTGNFTTNGTLTSVGRTYLGTGVTTGTAVEISSTGDTVILGGNLRVPDATLSNKGVIAARYCFGSNNTSTASPVNCITSWPAAIDTSTFLNTGATAQTKSGNLTVSALTLSTAASFASPAVAVYNGGRIQVGTTPAAVGSHADIGLAVYGANKIKYWDGTTNTTNMILAANASGVATWQDPASINIQKRVTGSCTVGSSITAIAADGTVTCGPKMQAGVSAAGSTNPRTITLPQAFSDTTYSVVLNLATSGGQDCATTVTSKTSSSFTFSYDGDCPNSSAFNWIAIDY